MTRDVAMPSSIRSILLVLFVTVVGGLPSAAEPLDQDRIKQLEQENDELRQQLAQLRLELSQVNRELEKHQSAAATDAATDATEKDTDENAPTDPEDKKKTRTFRSADEIYRSIPQDFKPARGGWSEVERQQVAAWLTENIPGQQFEASKKIASVKISRTPFVDGRWDVRLTFEYESMRYMNWGMSERLWMVTLSGDDAFAERAPKLYRKGKSVKVQGTIKRIGWDMAIIQKPGETWHPATCQLTLEDVQIR